jgi:predicted HTH domain antitoxin
MKTVNVSGLKNNPSEALRYSHDDLVLVMNRNEPDALIVGVNTGNIIDMPGVRKAMATALFKDGELSIARSAKLAKMALADFIEHISRLGIPIINQTSEEVRQDMDTLEQWLQKKQE